MPEQLGISLIKDHYLGIAWIYDLPNGGMWTEHVHSYDGLGWRRDRWVGYVAGEIQGELLTQVIGKPHDLRLNAGADPGGWRRSSANTTATM